MKKILSTFMVALAIISGLAISGSVHAEGEEDQPLPTNWIEISPTAAAVRLQGGQVVTGDSDSCPHNVDGGCVVEVKNIGAESFQYRIYTTPYIVSGEDYQLSFSESASTSYTQISRWITFLDHDGSYQREVVRTIAPGEVQKIQYRVDVPEDVPGGAQYAVIWAQTLNDPSASTASVQTISQAGMVITGRTIGDTRQTAEISEYDFTRFAFSGPLHANATIKNTGNTDFDAYYYYTAKTLFGKEVYAMNDSLATYPDTEYHINVDWENTPFIGVFQVEFKVSTADTVRSETHIVVILPIFVLILLIILLTIIIVWITIINRKRKERKARALV